MSITTQTKLNMIIGHPVEHSLSPQLHNAGYEALNIADQYVFLAAPVTPDELTDTVAGVRSLKIRGLTCTAPHKVAIMEHLDEIDPIAQRIGAVNTVVNTDGVLKGYNTDWIGIIRPLEAVTKLQGASVALIGAGGAARAAAYGLQQAGANVTIYNRTLEKATALAEEFGGQAAPLEQLDQIQHADIVINAISTNTSDHPGDVPAFDAYLHSGQIVFDIVYGLRSQQLLDAAKTVDATTIDGVEMLLNQGFEQFKLYTGLEAPEAAIRQAVRGES